MKDKISHLMKSENLTTTRFAEILGIQPSAVSHLVSGRNKPGFDLLQKILRRFPRVNPDWLLLDSDEVYRDDSSEFAAAGDLSPSSHSTNASQGGLFESLLTNFEPSGSRSHTNTKMAPRELKSGGKSPIFVVMFYDDGTCENFSFRG